MNYLGSLEKLQLLREHVVKNVPDDVTNVSMRKRPVSKPNNLWHHLGLTAENHGNFYTDFSNEDSSKWIDTRATAAPLAYSVIILFVELIDGGFGYNPERALAGKVKAIKGNTVKERLLFAIDDYINEFVQNYGEEATEEVQG